MSYTQTVLNWKNIKEIMQNYFQKLTLGVVLMLVLCASCDGTKEVTENRPNIVWIFVEDMNDWMGCYGDNMVPTPNIDKLAQEGIRFERAYMPAGVCSATRSAIALGAMQTSLGVHNHRSSRQRTPDEKIKLPDHIKTVYQLMRDNGYHVINNGPKNDFNFLWPTQNEKELKKREGRYGSGAYFTENKEDLLYDVNKPGYGFSMDLLKDRQDGKPVFLQIQLVGGKGNGKYEGAVSQKDIKVGRHAVYTDPEQVQVMPYYPDIPEIRNEIAHHYDNIRLTDDQVGQIILKLKQEGLYDNTVFFFWTDHGMKLPRHKQWLYEGGVKVPFVMAGPGVESGKVRSDLVSGIDITATTLTLGGIDVPQWMEGKNLLDEKDQREYVISARDRCDYTIERVRAVTTKRFKYIRNFLTDRPFMQPQYRDGAKFMKDMKAYYEEGKMNEVQAFIWSEERAAEELYDLENDPHEINNLAKDPAFEKDLIRHQKLLEKWIADTDDKGQYPESVNALKGVLTQWSKVAVNPEYEKAR
jgi:N-sulfoglucosamine sulfohydrolase